MRDFIIGGPAYRQQVHTRHLGAVVQLATLSVSMQDAASKWPRFVGAEYQHSSNLPQVRCLLLRDMIAQPGLKWFVSVDSDTTFDATHLLAEMHHVDGQ